MYSISDIIKAIRQPQKVYEELHWIAYRFRKFQYQFRNSGAHTGIDVMDQEWDNLIILDACRYDLFEETNTIPGELKQIQSAGTATGEWLEKNFQGGQFPDTVFVCSNPNLEKIEAEFADVIKVWETDWCDDKSTVLPEDVTKATLKTYEKHPNKRIISMFVQPHVPFLGEKGETLTQGGLTGGGVVKDSPDNIPIWVQLSAGRLDPGIVWQAYKENLEYVLPEVEQLVEQLDGTTVVSSDHGNAFGESGIYGHPGCVYIDALVTVPWLIASTGDRKITDANTLVSTTATSDDDLKERLSALGYR